MIVGHLTKRNDEWYTPKYAVKALLPYLKSLQRNAYDFDEYNLPFYYKLRILCPFDTENSSFVKVLRENGYIVDCSHIDTGKNFFSYTRKEVEDYDIIISNPPYSLKIDVFKKLFELEKPFAMLVGVVGLFDSKEKADLFSQNDFQMLYLTPRVQYYCPTFEGKIANPPYQSAYVCKRLLKRQIEFTKLEREKLNLKDFEG